MSLIVKYEFKAEENYYTFSTTVKNIFEKDNLAEKKNIQNDFILLWIDISI